MREDAELFSWYEAQGKVLQQAARGENSEKRLLELHALILEAVATRFLLPFDRAEMLQLTLTALELYGKLGKLQRETPEHRKIAELRVQMNRSFDAYLLLLSLLPQHKDATRLLYEGNRAMLHSREAVSSCVIARRWFLDHEQNSLRLQRLLDQSDGIADICSALIGAMGRFMILVARTL